MEHLADPPLTNVAALTLTGAANSKSSGFGMNAMSFSNGFRATGSSYVFESSRQAVQGANVSKEDIEALVRRFNKDRTHGRVTLKEFIDELTPKVPKKNY